MVQIVDPNPDPQVVKYITCRECGVKLSYVPNEGQSYQYSAMGETDTAYYIVCPNCGKTVITKS
jgi:DNA-directed RNA polymerase subunit RPC12/RpoP